MAYSKISYIGDGSTTSYTTPSYIEKSHITVMLDGVQSFEHSWTGPNTITFNTAPSAGAVIEIVRNSSQQTRMVNYQQPSPLDAETLNRDSKQAFYMAQEALDEASLALHRTPDGDSYDAEGNRIINVGSPSDGTDAATKSYVDIAVATGVPGGPITLFTVADYTELRGLTTAAYAANRVFVTNPAPGEFWHDAADTTSADDGGVIIVDADGRRWKRLESYAGYVCPTWWGAAPGGDPEVNRAAIQECFDKYCVPARKVSLIRFTRKGVYQSSNTLYIRLNGFEGYPFDIDLNSSAVYCTAMNVPCIEIAGGANCQWCLRNGTVGFATGQGSTNLDGICISFAGATGDGTSANGPNNGAIQNIRFERGNTCIGVRDKHPSDNTYTIWDVRIEHCNFADYYRHAINIRDVPAMSITAKNITIRSCYIADKYRTGLSTVPIMNFQNVMLLNIDDLEIIQTLRPVLHAFAATTDIRVVSIENPGSSSPPIPAGVPYLMRLNKSPSVIHSLNLMTLRADVGAGNRVPIISVISDEFNDLPVTVDMVDLFRLASVSGGFTLFGGNEYGRIIHRTPAVYHETAFSVCPLYEYDVAKSNSLISIRSQETYFAEDILDVVLTSGSANADVGMGVFDPRLTTVIRVLGTPTGATTLNLFPTDNATSMSNRPNMGPGRSVRIYRTESGPHMFTVDYGSGTVSIPPDYKGVITFTWQHPCNWILTDYSRWQ